MAQKKNGVYYLYDNHSEVLTIIGPSPMYIPKDNALQENIMAMCIEGRSFEEISQFISSIFHEVNFSSMKHGFSIIFKNEQYFFHPMEENENGEKDKLIPSFMIERLRQAMCMPPLFKEEYMGIFKQFILSQEAFSHALKNENISPYDIIGICMDKTWSSLPIFMVYVTVKGGKCYKVDMGRRKFIYDENFSLPRELIMIENIQGPLSEIKSLCISIAEKFWKKKPFPYEGMHEYKSFASNIIFSSKFISMVQKRISGIPEEYIDFIGASLYNPKRLFLLLASINNSLEFKS